MSVQQQQALDSLYAIDNVLTVTITMPDSRLGRGADGAAGRGASLQLRLEGRLPATRGARRRPSKISGTPLPRAVPRSPTWASRRSPSAARSTATSRACTSTSASSTTTTTPAVEALIGSRYLTLNNSMQDPSVSAQPLSYTSAGHGRTAPFAVQLRPGLREWKNRSGR